MPSDCEIEYQSKKGDIYKKYIKQLLDEGKAYKCYMSKDELAQLRATQEANKQTPRYDETWRPEEGKILPKIPSDIEPVIRIKAPKNIVYDFVDGVKGSMRFEANQVDDYIIARANGTPTYNFVVAIDDVLMGITDIIRGDDHLSNTFKQLMVYKALDFEIPHFYHVPMILNEKGKKLSKRDGATDVMEFKKLGFLPEALLNFLVRLGWSSKDKEIFSIDEMIELFDPNSINKSPSAYNYEKLLWINSHYIKNINNDKLVELLKEFGVDLSNYTKKEALLDAKKDRADTLLELASNLKQIIIEPTSYDEKNIKKFIKDGTIDMMLGFVDILQKLQSTQNATQYETMSKEYMDRLSIKMPQFAQPFRIAILGRVGGLSIFELFDIVGKDDIIKRTNMFLKYLNSRDSEIKEEV
jgi:glutamyl-tRNA synthetase